MTPIQKRTALAQLANKSFLAYLCYTDKTYQPSAVHKYLAQKLEAVERGEIKRLIITMPPRHGKSRMAAIEFPTWYLGKHPESQVIMSSYGDSLSLKHSREARDRCKNVSYARSFPSVKLNGKMQAKNVWGFMEGGTFNATTVGGGMTGLGADLLIIDDPHKNRQEAESKLVRDRVWEWFTSTAYTRLSRDGAIIIIMTRWHVDDLVGRLLSEDYTEKLNEIDMESSWHLVELPAICERNGDEIGRRKNEALWPERWDAKSLEGIAANIGEYDYTSLYRCTPRLRGGNVAKIDNIHYIEKDQVPDIELVRAWDLAITDKEKSDFTVGCLGGYDQETGDFYIVDIKRIKTGWFGVKNQVVTHGEIEKVRVGVEAVSGFKTAYEEIKKELMGIANVSYLVPKENKMIRANPWLARLEAGKVHLVKGEWNQAFIDELSLFPDGKHDDQVDAVTMAWEMSRKGRTPLLVA